MMMCGWNREIGGKVLRATFKDGFVEEAIFETEDDRIFKGLWSIVMAEASFSATSIVTFVILKGSHMQQDMAPAHHGAERKKIVIRQNNNNRT